ncbi:ubiquitin-activating E1 FCCH domain-containing protein [Phytohabitans sp. ZYX-F-186]|uniref:Ubiquitin-activating E1 FCCH domain-containing protein n=1 Tax=Phytohabitans maris TaxID=3071409 RepID=A0ABU0ZNR0_9ACTN|nr:ubiquitin-activating E1 FCCH domain-containing protein [Phytohabitans sp. ZYX-F-186]MDQ7908316.1 ubiquitin-activating E1 FCCH domain-containing protein [Phytohabitans sp. ZYX-F-186]
MSDVDEGVPVVGQPGQVVEVGVASFPTDSWLNTVYNGGIFAIPIPRAVVGTIMFARQDIIRQRGLPAAPASYAEFHELARGLSDARSNRWAFGQVKQVIVYIGNMLDVPNVWREQGGRFTHEIETPERKRAVGLAADMFKEGLFHPDAPGNKLQYRDLFGAGTISLVPDGYAAWDILANTYPEAEVGGIPEPGFDGGQGSHRAGTTSFGLTAFKKTDKARLEGLLRLCDWLAAPLGTSEYLFRKYGVEGVDFTWVDGKPKRDAGATQPDDGGTVFAVAGVAPGRGRRPDPNRGDRAGGGWRGTGAEDDSGRLRAAVAALPAGGIVEVGPGKVRIQSTVRVERVPVVFTGAGATDNLDPGTQFVVATGDQDGFLLRGAHGGGFRDLAMRGEGLTGGNLVATERIGSATEDGNYLLTFLNCRFRDGYNGIHLRACNTVRFHNCVWNGFNGQQVILLNGLDTANRADPVEFVQCAIAAGTANPGTDNIVIDGQGGSIKFISTAVLFGRHGIWMRNTTGEGLPKFLYFEGGGFENGHGVPVLLEAGGQAQFANTYISGDGEHDDVRIGEGFTGNATFTACVIRGSGRNGIDLASTRITVTGCVIGNNGRTAHPAFARPVGGAADNGAGKVRVTTAVPHGWETDDRITVQEVGGTTEANGKWRIAVVSPTAFDLPDVAFAHAYTGGGTAWRNGAGINIRATASRVVVVGNAIGSLPDGAARQDYGVVNAAADVLVADNDLSGNTAGPYLLAGEQTAQTRFTANKGVEQVDGWLGARLPGPVADGLYDLSGLLYVDGQRLKVTRVVRKVGAGTCDVRLETAGSAALSATANVQTTRLSRPYTVDGLSAPRRLRLRVSNAASASDLEVQFGYQVVA